MARVEGALARAGALAGLVPQDAAAAIARLAPQAKFNAAALAAEARKAGTLAIPFVRELTRQVAAASPDAARYVHFGATSQDVIDTALALCLEPACERVAELALRLGDAAAGLAERHRATPTLARTLLQPATPMPFGLKAAAWLDPLTRSAPAFRAAAREACVLQFGGAGGTLGAFGAQADAVASGLAAELALPRPAMPWHGARDRFARLGAEAAILAGAAGKVARDVSLLMQPEIGELAEPPGEGRGGSSALPHKRNPARSLLALEAALRAPGLAATLLAELTPEHERGLGQWQSQALTLRDLVASTAGALDAMAETLEGLQVDGRAMRANLDRTRGLAFSEAVSLQLARSMGKAAAHELVEKLCRRAAQEKRELREVLEAEKPGLDLDALFEPENGYGDAPGMIARALEQWRLARAK